MRYRKTFVPKVVKVHYISRVLNAAVFARFVLGCIYYLSSLFRPVSSILFKSVRKFSSIVSRLFGGTFVAIIAFISSYRELITPAAYSIHNPILP